MISKYNKETQFFLCGIDIFSKYGRFIPLKDKKSITIANAFQSIVDEFNHKQNNVWVDKGSDFYNRSLKSCLQDHNIEIYSFYIQ